MSRIEDIAMEKLRVLHMGVQSGLPNRLGIDRHIDKPTDKEID